MLTLVWLCFITSAVVSVRISYDGYKVYLVHPKTEENIATLRKLHDKNFDFWSPLRVGYKPVNIMVQPSEQSYFENLLTGGNITYNVRINNLEESIKREEEFQFAADRILSDRYSFNIYPRYDEVVKFIDQVAKEYPSIAQAKSLGKSFEGRNITMIKISSGSSGKPAIFIDCGIHAREWIGPPTCLYIIKQLVETADSNSLIEKVDWYVVPVLNPDGYEFTHTTDRMWRKTRSRGKTCYGADANRNYDFHWNEIGTSRNECSSIYAGAKPFSEKETQAHRDFLLANKGNIKLYLTFHSFGQYILFPWGWSALLPEDEPELRYLANKVNTAINSYRGTNYAIGSSTNVLYAAAGGSDDYAKAVAGIELSYTIELSGGNWDFDPPASEIEPVVEEMWLGVIEYHNHIAEKFK